jgi:hypothetical protein
MLARDMHTHAAMPTRENEQKRNDARREQAARIIAGNERLKRLKMTDELLLDQEALRQAAIRAGLEKPDQL